MGVALKRILGMCLRSIAFFCFFLVVPHDMHMICIVDVAYEWGLSFNEYNLLLLLSNYFSLRSSVFRGGPSEELAT